MVIQIFSIHDGHFFEVLFRNPKGQKHLSQWSLGMCGANSDAVGAFPDFFNARKNLELLHRPLKHWTIMIKSVHGTEPMEYVYMIVLLDEVR